MTVKNKLKSNIMSEIKKLIISALSLVAALAWNEAFQKLFSRFNPKGTMGIYGPWIYAFVITIITVIGIYFINI